MTKQHIHDENLRLVLSEEEKQWIDGELSAARRYGGVFSVLFLLCIGWLIYGSVYKPDVSSTHCVHMQFESTEAAQELKAQGLVICDETAKSEETNLWASSLVTICAVILIIGLPIGIGRNLFLYFKFRRYLKNHESFLEKYNRS